MKKITVTVEISVFGPDSMTTKQAEDYTAMTVNDALVEVDYEEGSVNLTEIAAVVKATGMTIGDYAIVASSTTPEVL